MYNKIVATNNGGEIITAMKKGTKLTENPKDYMLRVRLDGDTLKQLDVICEEKKQSRSEVVRTGISEQYEKTKK